MSLKIIIAYGSNHEEFIENNEGLQKMVDKGHFHLRKMAQKAHLSISANINTAEVRKGVHFFLKKYFGGFTGRSTASINTYKLILKKD